MNRKGFPRLIKTLGFLLILTYLFSCNSINNKGEEIRIKLVPMNPDENIILRYSPKGKKLALKEINNGLETELRLGDKNVKAINLRLEKAEGQKYFSRLIGDWNRNENFDDDSVITTTPNESRGKFWSSFNARINIPVTDPESGEIVINPYSMSLWYVEDPLEPDQEKVLRFSRRGWMQGSFKIDSVLAVILLAESEMDGVYDSLDSWALGTIEKPDEIYNLSSSRNNLNHAWLGEKAYKLLSIHPSGREVIVAAYDPGLTRAEEDRAKDYLAVDREAPHSGKSVNFSHDYENVLSESKKLNKLLFIDFETTWCGPCKTMDRFVYNSDAVVDALKDFLAVKIDGDENRDLVNKYDVKGYPTMIILSPRGKIIGRKTGYQSIKDIVKFVNSTL